MNNTFNKPTRPLYKIAEDIRKDWKNPYFGAIPYLEAMEKLEKITDNYIVEAGKTIVLYFLSNASTWRGEVARTIKTELKGMIEPNPVRKRKIHRDKVTNVTSTTRPDKPFTVVNKS